MRKGKQTNNEFQLILVLFVRETPTCCMGTLTRKMKTGVEKKIQFRNVHGSVFNYWW